MSGAFVLDASAAIAWASPDEAPPSVIADSVEGGAAVAPVLWLFEVHNTLVVLRRRRRLTGEDFEAAAAAVRVIPIELEAASRYRVEGVIAELADHHSLSVYDATYLELALRRDIPLLTLDRGLQRSARKAGLRLL